MLSFNVICILSYFLLGCTFKASGFLSNFNQQSRKIISSNFKRLDRSIIQPKQMTVGRSAINNRLQPLKDILGLGPAEIAITLVVGLVLFGPETLKSLSKDVGRAAAELKEIPKTFKEGMDEGVESTQVAKMKAIAAEKRLKRDAKRAAAKEEEDDDDESDA